MFLELNINLSTVLTNFSNHHLYCQIPLLLHIPFLLPLLSRFHYLHFVPLSLFLPTFRFHILLEIILYLQIPILARFQDLIFDATHL